MPKNAAEPIALVLSSPNFFIISSPPKGNDAARPRHIEPDTADLSRRFKPIVRLFIESSAGVAVLQHLSGRRPRRAVRGEPGGFRKPVAPSRTGGMPAFPSSLDRACGAPRRRLARRRPLGDAARRAARRRGGGGARRTMSASPPCSRSAPAMPLVVAADGAIAGADAARRRARARPRCRRAGWACSARRRPSRSAEAAGLGRHLADAAAGGAFSAIVRPAGSARVFRVDGGPAPAGFRASARPCSGSST